MSPASRRFRRSWPRFAGAAFLLASFAGLAPGAGASPPEAVPRPHPGRGAAPCVATSIDDLLQGDGLDLGRRGFELRRLGEGFVLESFGAHSQGICGEHGEILDQALSAVSTWDHGPSGSQVYLHQRQAAEPTANVLEGEWASFWWRGYAFEVSMASGCTEPPPNGVAEQKLFGPAAAAPAPPPWIDRLRNEQAARALPRAPEALSRAALPKLSPPPPCQPADRDLLTAAIAALAPDLDLACFHRRREGAWSDLAAFGLGDPRSALPPGFTEWDFHLRYFEPPAAGCSGPAPAGGAGVALDASFFIPGDSSAAVSAYSLPQGAYPSPGFLDDHSASWNDERFQYWAGVWSSSGFADRDLVLALAAALDLNFAEACLIETRYLTPAEAVALGFHLARPPAGYEEVSSRLMAQLPSTGCDDEPGAIYSLMWDFFDGVDSRIVALLYRDAGRGSDDPGAEQPGGGPGEGFLTWTDAEGTRYEVYGYSNSGGPGPAHELLVEVARSMDPTFGGS